MGDLAVPVDEITSRAVGVTESRSHCRRLPLRFVSDSMRCATVYSTFVEREKQSRLAGVLAAPVEDVRDRRVRCHHGVGVCQRVHEARLERGDRAYPESCEDLDPAASRR